MLKPSENSSPQTSLSSLLRPKPSLRLPGLNTSLSKSGGSLYLKPGDEFQSFDPYLKNRVIILAILETPSQSAKPKHIIHYRDKHHAHWRYSLPATLFLMSYQPVAQPCTPLLRESFSFKTFSRKALRSCIAALTKLLGH